MESFSKCVSGRREGSTQKLAAPADISMPFTVLKLTEHLLFHRAFAPADISIPFTVLKLFYYYNVINIFHARGYLHTVYGL